MKKSKEAFLFYILKNTSRYIHKQKCSKCTCLHPFNNAGNDTGNYGSSVVNTIIFCLRHPFYRPKYTFKELKLVGRKPKLNFVALWPNFYFDLSPEKVGFCGFWFFGSPEHQRHVGTMHQATMFDRLISLISSHFKRASTFFFFSYETSKTRMAQSR